MFVNTGLAENKGLIWLMKGGVILTLAGLGSIVYDKTLRIASGILGELVRASEFTATLSYLRSRWRW